MLKLSQNPYGYRNLLVYKKAEELQKRCSELTHLFPKSKTLIALGDQMDRSARSVKQNIVEGWKRNSTAEYYEFLGFAIAANAELEEDCLDIWKKVYPELMGIKGIMGKMGDRINGEIREIGENGLNGRMGEGGVGVGGETGTKGMQRGIMGEKPWGIRSDNEMQRGEREIMERGKEKISSASSASAPPSPHLPPLSPLPHFSFFDIEKLPFYPLDDRLPAVVQLKLRAKELNFLLEKLQKSLEQKMAGEQTLPAADRYRKLKTSHHNNQEQYEKLLVQQELIRLENGQIISRKEWEKRGKKEERG